MGCDIHMFCETRRKINGVNKWVNSDYWELNPYFGESFEPEYNIKQLIGVRNYDLFTALCGVRDTSGCSPKISEPRGLPDNCTKQVVEANKYWGEDGHSHSYVTLREVKEFVKRNEPIKRSGLITKEDAIKLDEQGILPMGWCQGSSNPNLVRVHWDDSESHPLVQLYELMSERLYKYSEPDNIPDKCLDRFRIVFWFDN